jgi:hypothetical protein
VKVIESAGISKLIFAMGFTNYEQNFVAAFANFGWLPIFYFVFYNPVESETILFEQQKLRSKTELMFEVLRYKNDSLFVTFSFLTLCPGL